MTHITTTTKHIYLNTLTTTKCYKMIDKDTTRAEKLQISIEETNAEIENLHLVIQKIQEVKDIARSNDTEMFNDNIEKLEAEINYLESIKENDEAILDELNCGLNNK